MRLDGFIGLVFTLIYVAILGRIILSFVIPMLGGRPNPVLLQIYDALAQITEPILGPIRNLLSRVLPSSLSMFDFSPVVAIILLKVVEELLKGALGKAL